MVAGTQVGAYRVLQQIGTGGMGSVWLAEHVMLGRRAAIKLLHPMYSARPDIVTRFFNEARAAAAISDPGIVQIFDFGQHEGTAFIAMELLEGEPLDRRLGRLGRLPLGDALRIMRQVATTLGVAHARGIVHRDLKPENVYLVRDSEVAGGERAKLLDFGIAKLTGDPSVQTQTSAVMGTPAYMSPEQCRGAGQVDQRSDVYSLGCLLFALITGSPPFVAEGSGEVIAMHLREPPPAPSSRLFGLPPEIDALVLRCLAKDPAQRFASATELAVAIGEIAGSVSSPNWRTGRAGQPSIGTAIAATTLSGASGATGPFARIRGRGLAFAGIAAVLVGGAIAVVMSRGGGRAAPAEPASVPPPAVAPQPEPPAPRPEPPPPRPEPPPAPVTPPPAAVPAPLAPPPDPSAGLAARMTEVLARFTAWSKDHAGAACPSAAELGDPVVDPWGRPLAITCTDQPANQIVGVISAGPDGVAGTADDIGSWQLPREVTERGRGSRWKAAPAVSPPRPAPPRSPPRPRPHRDDFDDIPTQR
jgi:serine/threonine-protein kinase